MKNIRILFMLTFVLLILVMPNVFAGELVVNKDEAIAAGFDVNSFTEAIETAGYFACWTVPLENNKDAVLHVKVTLDENVKPYVDLLAVYLAGKPYSKEQAIAKFPTFRVINWSNDCIEYTIQIHTDSTVSSRRYGVLHGIEKLPDNIEAAYVYYKGNFELFDLSDLENPIATKIEEPMHKRIADKKNVSVDTSIAKIENDVIGEYNKHANSVKSGDELSIKVVIDRPYGVLNSGKVSITGKIPDGFSYIPGSANYINSDGYTNVNSIDDTTGIPILTINNMPVGENTIFTFKIKANKDTVNTIAGVVLKNIFQNSITISNGIKGMYPDWFTGEVYKEDEYTKTVVTYINTEYLIKYDSNGGTGEVVDNKSYAYTDEDGANAIVLGNSNISKKNYKFIGWNTSSDGTGKFYQAGDGISLTSNTKLFAIWESINNPNTGDPIILSIILGSISLMSFLGVGSYIKKRNV